MMRTSELDPSPGGEGSVDLGHARLTAILMNVREFGSLLHSPLRKWSAAAVVACGLVPLLVAFLATAGAAPNPVSGAKTGDGFQTAAPHAILIEAESGSVLFEKDADDLIPPGQPVQADDRGGRVQRDQGRAGSSSTEEFIVSTNAWRKGGAPSRTSSMFVADPQPGDGRRPAARRDHPVGQRRLHRAGRRHRRQRGRLRRADDQARARARPDQVDLRQFDRPARPAGS